MACVLLTLAVGLAKVEASGAVPVEEFAPAGVLYASIPVLTAIGLLSAGWAVLRFSPAIRGPGTLPKLLPLGILLMAGGVLASVLILIGAGLFLSSAAGLLVSRERAGTGGPLPPPRVPRPADIVASLVVATSLAALAVWFLGLVDAATYTSRFVPRLITPEEFAEYRSALPGLAFCFGLQVGPVVVAAVLLVWALGAGLARLLRVPEPGRPLLFALLTGLALGSTVVLLFRLNLADELDEIGIAGELALLGILGGLALGWTGHRRLVRLGRLDHARSPLHHTARMLLLALVPPRFLVGRDRQLRILRSGPLTVAAVMLTGLAILLLLSLFLYPSVEDFRSQAFESYAYLAALLATALLVAPGLAMSARARRFAFAGLGAVLLAGGFALRSMDGGFGAARLVAHEYSRIGALAARTATARWLDSFPDIGREPEPGFRFVHHAPGEERYAPLPASLAGAPDRPPIVILVWDAVRADHTTVFGYERATTPNLERFSEGAIRFPRAYSTATATTASVRNILTGRYCNREMRNRRHPPYFVKELAEAGYDRFVLTVTATDINGVSGDAFERGWDSDRDGLRFHRIVVDNQDAHDTRRVLDTWKRLVAERPERGLAGSFTYMHLTGPHSPWKGEDKVRDFGSSPEDLYDAEIAKVDHLLAGVLATLRDLGELERVVFVITADHGTGLEEHGRYGGFFPYEEQIRVPLMIRAPGLAPREVRDPVTHLDLAPTLLNLLGFDGRHRFDGRSLLPLMTGEVERLSPRERVCFNSFQDGFALTDREGRYKLMHSRWRRYEALFDLRSDPRETRNLIAREPEVADRMRRLLAAFLWQGRETYDRR